MNPSIIPCGKEQPHELKSATIGSVLWESATEAAMKTALILLLGSVAMGLVGGLLHDMAPSAPPGIEAKPFSRGHGLGVFASAFQKHRVIIVFALVFGLTTLARLRPFSGPNNDSVARQAGRRFSADWFGVVVGNAFGAMGIAIALYWLERVSIARWIYGWLIGAALPAIQDVGNLLLGKARVDLISDWLAWYADNQLKFNFWIIYLAAICDDLGIPNFKSLGRWLWRRLRVRWSAPQMKPSTATAADE
jgi:hypothetical protein